MCLKWLTAPKFGYKEKRQLREVMRLDTMRLLEKDEDIIKTIENQMVLCERLYWKDYKLYARKR